MEVLFVIGYVVAVVGCVFCDMYFEGELKVNWLDEYLGFNCDKSDS
jgi:hypothetical protein